jgi:hypothetical protein
MRVVPRLFSADSMLEPLVEALGRLASVVVYSPFAWYPLPPVSILHNLPNKPLTGY